MNASSPTSSGPRVPPNLRHAFGGIWRLTLRRFLAPNHWIALVIALGALALLGAASTGPSGKSAIDAREYFQWAIQFYLTFMVPIFAFVTAGGALRDDLKPESVDYIFTRPIPRPFYILAKFCSHVACAQADYLLGLIVLLGVGLYLKIPGLLGPAPLMLLSQIFLVAVFSAFGFLFGLLTSRFVIIGLVYGFVIEVGVGQIPTQLSRLSMTHQVRALFGTLLAPSGTTPPPDGNAVFAVAVMLALTLVLLAASAALFSFRELASAQNKEA